ncbi:MULTISPECIES: DUF2939 domain-containing protein [Caulobacter]|jgi:hypothetical protein|uniref:DUF2939 domain-containing protein n=1 Tax=Caulobacter vibrioides OR37 TaxID=1292034 RepID=R0E4R8_CAUVI|nr:MULTISPECIES: DUF2939 domain-containing protein [Caulobacter]ENZ80578.1 hypothetical protein OR37_03490 [Caulobacter vibrioides OR37]MBQ1562024.1 DUF2939 domain-containing protein [Caulobacter sp.]
MTLQKRIWDLIVLAIFVFAAAFATAPWFAFRALKAAAQYEDVQAIGELVDFPAVRRSLTAELVPAAPASQPEPPSIWRDPLSVFKQAVEPIAPPEPKVDRYLTVAGVAALTRGYAPGKAPPASTQDVTASGRIKDMVKGPFPQIAYWDPNRARIAVKRPDGSGKVTIFTFERRALFTWRLVHIRLPGDERQG